MHRWKCRWYNSTKKWKIKEISKLISLQKTLIAVFNYISLAHYLYDTREKKEGKEFRRIIRSPLLHFICNDTANLDYVTSNGEKTRVSLIVYYLYLWEPLGFYISRYSQVVHTWPMHTSIKASCGKRNEYSRGGYSSIIVIYLKYIPFCIVMYLLFFFFSTIGVITTSNNGRYSMS